jgi:hypothetical protein
VTRPEKEAPDAEDSFDDLFDFAEDGDQGTTLRKNPSILSRRRARRP